MFKTLKNNICFTTIIDILEFLQNRKNRNLEIRVDHTEK